MGSRTVAPAMGRLFTTREAATFLGISPRRVQQLLHRGELVAVRNGNGRLEGIYEADCQAWIESHRQQSPRRIAASDVDRLVDQLEGADTFA
jgi:excisionase family DNA binding protein